MNKVVLIGRLIKDPDVRYSNTGQSLCIARYTLAVDRRKPAKDGAEQSTDFISCVAFGKSGEFAEKYLRKGMKIAVIGRIQTGSFAKQDGTKVYTTDVVVEEHEFVESKTSGQATSQPPQPQPQTHEDFWSNLRADENLPFK